MALMEGAALQRFSASAPRRSPVASLEPKPRPSVLRCCSAAAGVQKSLTAAACDTVLKGKAGTQLWGEENWVKRSVGEPGCWGNNDGQAFFQSVFNGDGCNVNWFEGVRGEVGEKDSRPAFKRAAPALIGDDAAVFAWCSQVIHEPTVFNANEGVEFNQELARRCEEASENIFRRQVPGANMCLNFRWLVCAAQGKLPGQGAQAIEFASAPNEMDLRVYDDPARGNGWWKKPHESHYSATDVQFAEICILQKLCARRDQLFLLEAGDPFTCVLDSQAVEPCQLHPLSKESPTALRAPVSLKNAPHSKKDLATSEQSF